jgi:hypothetical protein
MSGLTGQSKAESLAREQHYHKAHYDDRGLLTRKCGLCGEDLTHPTHVRETLGARS